MILRHPKALLRAGRTILAATLATALLGAPTALLAPAASAQPIEVHCKRGHKRVKCPHMRLKAHVETTSVWNDPLEGSPLEPWNEITIVRVEVIPE